MRLILVAIVALSACTQAPNPEGNLPYGPAAKTLSTADLETYSFACFNNPGKAYDPRYCLEVDNERNSRSYTKKGNPIVAAERVRFK